MVVETVSGGFVIVIGALLLIDAVLLPRLLRACAKREVADRAESGSADQPSIQETARARDAGPFHLHNVKMGLGRCSKRWEEAM